MLFLKLLKYFLKGKMYFFNLLNLDYFFPKQTTFSKLNSSMSASPVTLVAVPSEFPVACISFQTTRLGSEI